MKNIIKYIAEHIIFVILPFLCYGFSIVFFKNETNYGLGIFFYFLLLLSVFYFITYNLEKVFEHQENTEGRFKFLVHTLGIIFFLSITFSSYYWCLYNHNNLNFSNVNSDNQFKSFLDLSLYSFGVFVMNNTSEIHANTLYAKLFVGTEMLTAFTTLILILANYKDLKSK